MQPSLTTQLNVDFPAYCYFALNVMLRLRRIRRKCVYLKLIYTLSFSEKCFFFRVLEIDSVCTV